MRDEAKVAYESWVEATDRKDAPKWSDLPQEVRWAWDSATQATMALDTIE